MQIGMSAKYRRAWFQRYEQRYCFGTKGYKTHQAKTANFASVIGWNVAFAPSPQNTDSEAFVDASSRLVMQDPLHLPRPKLV
eukprot:346493-Amphidinium_carterae.1